MCIRDRFDTVCSLVLGTEAVCLRVRFLGSLDCDTVDRLIEDVGISTTSVEDMIRPEHVTPGILMVGTSHDET